MTVAILTEEAAGKLLSTIKIPPRPAVVEQVNLERRKENPDLNKVSGLTPDSLTR
ncbi:MAG: hypothetical protein HY306_02095 [Nitrosomonadales bacterium]|nr:hypothetical protein [Nitrosomonadales bacterium]